MKFTRRSTLALIGAAAVARPSFAQAQPNVFIFDGFAIRGFDPVAYFDQTNPGPVMGNSDISYNDGVATWLFASQITKEAFLRDQERFRPRYGGYCAYAVSKGGIATTDPNAWTVYQNRLYLNYSMPVLHLWRRDIPGNTARADKNWPGVLG
ncbi:MAG: YHS domain protein [Rhodobacteraceae bacterium]|nr:YHS domain protein [Paracoccaceae bacterium]